MRNIRLSVFQPLEQLPRSFGIQISCLGTLSSITLASLNQIKIAILLYATSILDSSMAFGISYWVIIMHLNDTLSRASTFVAKSVIQMPEHFEPKLNFRIDNRIALTVPLRRLLKMALFSYNENYSIIQNLPVWIHPGSRLHF